MAYVTVPKDLTHVKSKVLFGLTKRQLVCFGGALFVRFYIRSIEFIVIAWRSASISSALSMI